MGRAGRRIRKFFTKRLVRLGTWILAPLYILYMHLVWMTSRVEHQGFDRFIRARKRHEGGLAALWHENVFFVAHAFRELNGSTLASESDFGTLITSLLKLCNFEIFRGGSGKKKRSSRRRSVVLELIRHMQGHRYVLYGITVDGSRGPAHVLKPGVVALASKTGVPIFTLHIASRPVLRVKTWDRTRIPVPFGRYFMLMEGPLFVPVETKTSREAFEAFRLELEEHLRVTAARAEGYLDTGTLAPAGSRNPEGYGEAEWRRGARLLRPSDERLRPVPRKTS